MSFIEENPTSEICKAEGSLLAVAAREDSRLRRWNEPPLDVPIFFPAECLLDSDDKTHTRTDTLEG